MAARDQITRGALTHEDTADQFLGCRRDQEVEGAEVAVAEMRPFSAICRRGPICPQSLAASSLLACCINFELCTKGQGYCAFWEYLRNSGV